MVKLHTEETAESEPVEQLFVGSPGLLTPSKPAPRDPEEMGQRLASLEKQMIALGQRMSDLAAQSRALSDAIALLTLKCEDAEEKTLRHLITGASS